MIVLFAIQIMLAANGRREGGLSGDEYYYVRASSDLIAGQRFKPASDDHYAVLTGDRFGQWSDYRPPGYPAFLAMHGITGPHAKGIISAIIFQSAVVAAALLLIFLPLLPHLPTGLRYGVAVLIGSQPWTFEYAASLYPDSLNAGIFVIGAVLLCAVPVGARKYEVGYLARVGLGAVLLTSTIWLRPEMYVFCLFGVILVALAWYKFDMQCIRPTVTLVLIFAVQMSLFISYRMWFEGRPFATFVHATPGVEEWAKTWPGGEQERYKIVWGIRKGNVDMNDVPERAISTPDERERIESAIQASRVLGYSRQADEIFASIAAERKTRVFTGLVLPRLWFTLNIWVNFYTSPVWLTSMADWPAILRKPALGIWFLVKLVVVAVGGCLGLYLAFRFASELKRGRVLTFFASAFVIARTVFVGAILASNEHRYMLIAWPFMLFLFAVVSVRYLGARTE